MLSLKKKQKVEKKFSINVSTCKDLRFILFNSAVMETAQAVNKFVGNYWVVKTTSVQVDATEVKE